ncbi:MAG TPA: ATP-binding protein [Planctomycetota bacterium]|nr:ATP-binding protein [Planctomycetota bacterium]
MDTAKFELKPEGLTSTIDQTNLKFTSTDDLSDPERMMGQDRAMRSLEFGTEIEHFGYNLYALGPPGSGRESAVKMALEKRAAQRPKADDWIYVNNFNENHKPIAIRMPVGKGKEFRDDVDELIKELGRQLPQAFDGEHYRNQRDRINQDLQQVQSDEFMQLQKRAREKGFALQQAGNMFGIIPLVDGEPINPENYESLPEERRQEIEVKGRELRDELNAAVKRVREAEKQAKHGVEELNRRVATFAVGHLIEDLRNKYRDNERIVNYLNNVQNDIVENVQEFLQAGQPQEPVPFMFGMRMPQQKPDVYSRYAVNVLVDNSEQEGAPVVFESNPTYCNLMGRIEHKAQFGAMVTDFTMIKAGSLHRANGGYLVLHARDLLMSFMSYDALKRSLKNQRIKIEEMTEMFRLISTVTLEPEPIPLDVKVVIIGQPFIYYLLWELDEDFRKLFKVKSDFDYLVDRKPQMELEYAKFIAKRCREEKLTHFAPSGVAEVLRYSSRLVEDQRKLTSTLLDINDIVRESAFWAAKRGNKLVGSDDVKEAVKEREYRSNRVEERIRELIHDGTIMIDVAGEVVGQVNGISVIQLGDYAFGRPSRITARTYMGKRGVVNIEREVRLSGRIHNKGVLILVGYLGGKFAHERPLTISASITFEQLYEGVEGDSASSSEAYCLLSSLGGVPIKQSIAVTGSINQHGRIQPVGGVTQKVEGFYYACKVKGLTGEQGVTIPKLNEPNLVLKDEVIEAVRDGKFHIYAVETLDEGIEILTGRPAGELQPDGTYPEGTVYRAVDDTLRMMTENLAKLAAAAEHEKVAEMAVR